jgi:hypothetical protein
MCQPHLLRLLSAIGPAQMSDLLLSPLPAQLLETVFHVTQRAGLQRGGDNSEAFDKATPGKGIKVNLNSPVADPAAQAQRSGSRCCTS